MSWNMKECYLLEESSVKFCLKIVRILKLFVVTEMWFFGR